MNPKYITAIFLYFFVSYAGNLFAQGTVDIKDIAVMKFQDNTKGLLVGDPISKAITIFGKPISKKITFSEIDEKQLTLYTYPSNTILYFMEGALVGYNLNIGTYTVGRIKGTSVKTSAIAKRFYNNLVVTKSRSINIAKPENREKATIKTELWKSGDVRSGNVIMDYYFQINFIDGSSL